MGRADTTRRVRTLKASGVEEAIGETLFDARSDGDAERILAREAAAFLEIRPADDIKVRVYNPDPELACVTIVETLAPDAPFLVESVLAALNHFGCEPTLIAHPILRVRRTDNGGLAEAARERETAESFIHIHIRRIEGDAARTEIAEEIRLTLADAQLVARDTPAMWRRVNEALAACTSGPPSQSTDEARQFLEWMLAGNVLLMGVRTYRHINDTEGGRLEGLYDYGLGILRDPSRGVLLDASNPHAYTAEYRAFLRDTATVAIDKSSARARISQRVEMDYIAVRVPDDTGAIRGELKILGLFSPNVYTDPLRDIPILNRRSRNVIARSGFEIETHAGKTLARILEEYPRDELFQLEESEILSRALEILPLYSVPRIKVTARIDRFGRFVYVLLHIPRDRYDSELRRDIGAYLERIFDGELSEFRPAFPHGTSLARVRFVLALKGTVPGIDEAAIEAEIVRLSQTWAERLGLLLLELVPVARAARLRDRYMAAFGAGYQERFAPDVAITDIERIERLSPADSVLFRFYRIEDDHIGLKIYASGQPMALSRRVPMLDAMGFLVVSERTYEIAPESGGTAWLHDMTLRRARGGGIRLELAPLLETVLDAVNRGDAESDFYNALVLEAGMTLRDITLLRALSRYQHQIGIAFSQDYMALVAVRHADILADVVRLFYARFEPAADMPREDAQAAIVRGIESRLDGVESADEDRILRRCLNLVQAAERTSFFQTDLAGSPRPAIAFKFDAARVDGMPDPRPLYEVFVVSPRVEGVHLRFGKVARGGLRWSDRQEDFRTEVLGLVKAQQVKNALIVPLGAKGGFIAKKLPPASDRDAWLAEGTAAYRIFISSMLDLVDNIVDGTIVPPAQTVRHDGDDPYLVVAADKGTGTFSDIANAIAVERGFWLGDAFASGGSAGYDHKKMGITARGAWEAVKRHFREIGTDIQTTAFTVAGIGDMSGDVFGNAMLLSPKIRLIAAFDHRHVFIDPNPDPVTSYAERKRLFELPRSSWADYDPALISTGGGIYPRAAKRIDLSPEASDILGIAQDASPNQVMAAILKLDVDLLYFGGIGTFVRAGSESNADAGDRGNDPVRITGSEIRAKVIGEGANLPLTQRGRIEAALSGVRLNTDAIDNSAGVNTSDYEVNIKIALAPAIASGRLPLEARNALLSTITDDIAVRVLANNHSQTLALTCAQRLDDRERDLHRRLIQILETRKLLNRSLEFLPDEGELERRVQQGAPFTRPELAVLLAYAKNALYARILESLPDDPYLFVELVRYFPRQLLEQFGDDVHAHPLRREIAATCITNSMMDLGGPAFPIEVTGDIPADASSLVRAFITARDAFRIPSLVTALHELDTSIAPDLHTDLYVRVRSLLAAQTAWMLRELQDGESIGETVNGFRDAIDSIRELKSGLVPASFDARFAADFDALSAAGIPAQTAAELARLGILEVVPDAVRIAQGDRSRIPAACGCLLSVLDYFSIAALRDAASKLVVTDRYETQLRDQALLQLARAIRDIASASFLAGRPLDENTNERFATEALRKAVHGFISAPSLARLCVVGGMLGDFALCLKR